MYLHLRVNVHSPLHKQVAITTQYLSLAVESRTRVPFYLGLVSWMNLYLRVDVHSGTRTQNRRFKRYRGTHLYT
ncbi:unnamed protein product [Schistosoma curassoni]|uniref:Ovule protein n=1 Tax=Schistosoma curassoni TaxID=6186 RepID=A0A183K049_9TREM|nr:unnamed protein product [Schistosoma curassoni]